MTDTSRRKVVLSLGSNLGDRLANLQAGIDLICASDGIDCQAVSGVYSTSPVGGPGQPDFLNAVLVASTTLPARAVLQRCQDAERAANRVRTVRWGPRTLDVDVIACGDEISDDPELTLPHPRARERGFVLIPWHEIDPVAKIPGDGAVANLIGKAGGSGVSRLDGPSLRLRPGGGEDR